MLVISLMSTLFPYTTLFRSTGKGKTVAVLGTGVDVIYPKENTRLSEQILGSAGALVSEFPLGTFAAPQNFPIRDRKSTRLNSSHRCISYAVFCLKKKK